MTANYYRHAHAVIFVYSVDDEGSLYALNDWVREAKSMNRQPENLVLAVWGSKSDLDSSSSSAVKQEAVDAFTSAYHIPPHLNCKVSIFGSSAELAMNELVEHVDRLFNGSAAADMQPLHRDFDTLTPQQLVPPTDAQRKTWNCCSGIRS